MVGNDADTFLGIAPIIDENADKYAAGLPFSNADRQVLIELSEAAGLQNIGQHIRGDFGIPLLQAAHAVGRKIGGNEGNHDCHYQGGIEERTEQPERRKAGSVHHDDLGIGRELVQRVRDRDHQGDRRDDQHQRRNDQTGDAEEGDDRLTLAGHQVDAAQRLRNPDHPRQADQNQRKRRERRAKDIPVDRPHRYRTPRTGTAAGDHPEIRIPFGRAAIGPAAPLSH